jgi:large subunit ribosomal protein L31
MQTGIHPEVFNDAVVICTCGVTHKIPGTVKEQHVEVCSECHPFYTGKIKIVDTAGRIDKFKARMAAKDTMTKTPESK